MSRMPFRRKHSPSFCQTPLSHIVRPLIPEGYLLFHYLDDFLSLRPDPVRLRAVTVRVVRALEEAGFLVSAKSTLELVTEIFFPELNTSIEVCARREPSHALFYRCLTSRGVRPPDRALHPACFQRP